MKHEKPLRENEDFFLLDKTSPVTVTNHAGERVVKQTRRVWHIYALDSDEERYLCSVCRQFTALKPTAVISHLGAHSEKKKLNANVADMRRDARAFQLLPLKMRKHLLAKLAEEEQKHQAPDHEA